MSDIAASSFSVIEKGDIEALFKCVGHRELFCSMCLLMNNDKLTKAFFENDSVYDILFNGTPYEQSLTASPYCRQELLTSAFTGYLLRQRPAGFGWLGWGAATWQDTVAHWRSLLTVTMPNGTPTHLRFYSGGVMAALLQGCSKAEVAAMLGPMSGMLIPLSEGKWLRVEHPVLENGSVEDIAPRYQYRPAPWWKVSEAQCAALNASLEGVLVHNIRIETWTSHPDWAEPFDSFAELDEFIADGLKDAVKRGFAGTEEQTQFVKLRLAGGIDSFEGMPACETILRSAETSNAHKLGQLAKLLGVVPWPA